MEDLESFFEEHAISSEIGRGRYTQFESNEKTRPYYELTDLAENQERDLSKMLNWMEKTEEELVDALTKANPGKALEGAPETGGLIIHRTPPPGYPPMTPELKPWTPMLGRKTVHYHGDPTTEPLFNPQTGKPLHQIQILTEDEAREHIDGRHHGGNGEPHSGTNSQEVHVSTPEQKYRFLASPIVYERRSGTHRRMFDRNRKMFANHLVKRHAFRRVPDVDEEHNHSYSEKLDSDADRIDLHSRALPLFESARRVFYVIEGCVKSDSVLSAGEAVFSVPSVGMWLVPELETFIEEYLLDKTVIVVPDADWAEKDQVAEQAKLCREFLLRYGLAAHIAAPPLWTGHKGIDDFRAAGGDLDDMEVLDWETPDLDALDALCVCDEWDSRRVIRAGDALHSLILFAGNHGRIYSSVKKLARVMGVNPERVRDGVKDLETLGLIEIEKGALATTDGDWRSGSYRRGLDWEERPRIKITRDDLLAKEKPRQRLGDLEFGNQSNEKIPYLSSELLQESKRVRDIAVSLDIKNGYTLEDVAKDDGRGEETVRKIPRVAFELRLRHARQQLIALDQDAKGRTKKEIVGLFGERGILVDYQTIRRLIKHGEVSSTLASYVERDLPPLGEWDDKTVRQMWGLVKCPEGYSRGWK
jgi:hypothetical protein